MWWYGMVSNSNILPILIYCKMFSTGDLVHRMLNTLDTEELSGTLTATGHTLPGNFHETL